MTDAGGTNARSNEASGEVPTSLGQRLTAPLRAMRADDLVAFNHHLAALATAGLPLEAGLRLAASEARTASVRSAIEALAADLEKGVPLAQAFDNRRGTFPVSYSRLMDGVAATNNLPALLLSLGKHQETVARMRALVSRALAYPMVVFTGVLIVAGVLSILVLPAMAQTYEMVAAETAKMAKNWYFSRNKVSAPRLPLTTQFVIAAGPYIPAVVIAMLAALLATPVVVFALRVARLDGAAADAVGLRLPLIGSALRHSALARFVDALSVSTLAGVDLPRGLRMSASLLAYPRISRDAELLALALESGQVATGVGKLALLPRSLVDAMAASSGTATLGPTLESLAALHRQQAELQAQRIPLVLIPIAVLGVGAVIALMLAAVLSPMGMMMRSFTSAGF